jgi:hypothetical protein
MRSRGDSSRQTWLGREYARRDWDGAFRWWRRSGQRDRGIVDYLLVAAQKPGCFGHAANAAP